MEAVKQLQKMVLNIYLIAHEFNSTKKKFLD